MSVELANPEGSSLAASTGDRTADAGEPAQGVHVYDRIGRLARTLHDALSELGYDRPLEEAAGRLPDARDRLEYVATLTGRAAERALNAVENAMPIQDALAEEAAGLKGRWNLDRAPDPALVAETLAFLDRTAIRTDETRTHLTEILMAQDFHDLTGQVIKRITELASFVEQQLLQLLVAATPASPTVESAIRDDDPRYGGPVINPGGRTDVAQNQSQVDSLLESLGF